MFKKFCGLKYQSVFFIVVCLGVAGSDAQSVSWKSTTAQSPWVDKEAVAVTTWDNDKTLYITVDEATKSQVIDGWGGAINEFGWTAMSVLSPAGRDSVLKAMFDTSGCAINFGRISIGANDYSSTVYSCDDSPNDYTMANFSLDKDKTAVIPFALAAKAINPKMTFWASPHSPPAWMKQNNSMVDGSMKTDDATRKAWALYFQKWVQGMATEGIPISAVFVQNEPNITGVGYPSCIMSGAEMATLIKNYLGPQFKTNNISAQIWLGTLQSSPSGGDFYAEYIPPALGDAATNAMITGVGMQWAAISNANMVPQNYPAKKAWQTEQQCGNFWWNTPYNTTAAPNEWAYGVFTVHRIMQWLRLGMNMYSQWNMVLDEIGRSNSTVHAWPQNSMISVNKTTKAVRYNPQFYAVKHFSYYVKPGAKRIATGGNYSTGGSNLLNQNLAESVTDGDMIAFLNPNGDKVLVLRNTTNSDKAVAVQIGTSKIKPTIPANSINTFLIKSPVAVLKPEASNAKTPKFFVHMNSGSVTLTISTPTGIGTRRALLSILDVSGSVVRSIRPAAWKDRLAFEWNGKNENGMKAAPGVYFARIALENELLINKFTLPR